MRIERRAARREGVSGQAGLENLRGSHQSGRKREERQRGIDRFLASR